MLWSGRPGGGSCGAASTLRPGSPVRSSSTSNSRTSSSGLAVAAYRPHIPSGYAPCRRATTVDREVLTRGNRPGGPHDLGATRRPPHARRDVRRRRARPAEAPGPQGRGGAAARRHAGSQAGPAGRHRAARARQRGDDGRRRLAARPRAAPPHRVHPARSHPRAHDGRGPRVLGGAGPRRRGPSSASSSSRTSACSAASSSRPSTPRAGRGWPTARTWSPRARTGRPARRAARRGTPRARRPARPS